MLAEITIPLTPLYEVLPLVLVGYGIYRGLSVLLGGTARVKTKKKDYAAAWQARVEVEEEEQVRKKYLLGWKTKKENISSAKNPVVELKWRGDINSPPPQISECGRWAVEDESTWPLDGEYAPRWLLFEMPDHSHRGTFKSKHDARKLAGVLANETTTDISPAKNEIDQYGDKRWVNEEGELHRVDGPAVELVSGYKAWWIENKRHRLNGPAIEDDGGTISYWINGKKLTKLEFRNHTLSTYWPKTFPSVDGIFIERKDGGKDWYQKDGSVHHNLHGPAVFRPGPDGLQVYCINGLFMTEKEFYAHPECAVKRPESDRWPEMTTDAEGTKRWRNEEAQLHRLDGPAIVFANGAKTWWINDKRFTEEKFHNHPKSTHWPKMTVDGQGTQFYRNKKGEFHRLDGHAVIYTSGKNKGSANYWINDKLFSEEEFNNHPDSTHWPKMKVDNDGDKKWKNEEGQPHREDGPAYVGLDGYKEWLVNGSLHRVDGPAIEYASGTKRHWIEGKALTEEEFQNHPKSTHWPKMTVAANGTKQWRNERGEYHRIDAPAFETVEGHKEWFIDNKLHRVDGPAIEYSFDGRKEYWIDGQHMREKEFYKHPKCMPLITLRPETDWKALWKSSGHKIFKDAHGVRYVLNKKLSHTIGTYIDHSPTWESIVHTGVKLLSGHYNHESLCSICKIRPQKA